EQARLKQFVAADPDILRTFLPRQFVLAGNTGHAARLDRIENAIAHAKQEICRGKGDCSSAVSVSENEADGWDGEVGELRDQPGNGVRLVVTVCNLTGISARRIDEGNNRHRTPGKLPDDFNSSQVVFRHPDAAVPPAFLGENTHASGGIVTEIQKH